MKKLLIIVILILASFTGYSNQPIKPTTLLQNETQSEIQSLKKQNEVLEDRLREIEVNDYKSLDVITKVDDFYDSAWNKLVAFLSIAGGIILFVLPYLLARNQEKIIELKKQEFESYTNGKLEELEEKLRVFHQQQFQLLKDEINLTSAELNKTLKTEIDNVHSMSYYLRGLIAELNEEYDRLINNFVTCAKKLLETENINDLKDVIRAILIRVIKIDKNNIQISAEVIENVRKINTEIQSNYPDIFSDSIEKIEQKLVAISNKSYS